MSLETRERTAASSARRALDAIDVPEPTTVVRRARRHTRVRVAALVGAAVVAVGVAVPLTLGGGDDGRRIVGSPTETSVVPGRAIGDRYAPPVSHDGATTVMPVTFLDGRRIELRYPSELGIAELGTITAGTIEWDVRTTVGPDGLPLSCCSRVVSVRYATVTDVYGDVRPTKTFPDADGAPVGYYRGIDAGRTNPVDYLVFQFGPWLVEVYDVQQPGDFEVPMTDDELATWARKLHGRIGPDGYLLLEPDAPLRLVVGDEPAVIGRPAVDEPMIEFFDAETRCAQGATTKADSLDRFPGAAQWCDTEAGVRVSVSGPTEFVDAVVAGLEVERG